MRPTEHRKTAAVRENLERTPQNRSICGWLGAREPTSVAIQRMLPAPRESVYNARKKGFEMLALLLAAAITPNSVPAIVGALEGCWKAPGEVRGKNATSVARGEWHLGRRYFVLHLKSVPPAQAYEAAIAYGAGEKKGGIGSFWMDTFGGLSEPSLGLGTVNSDGFDLDYKFKDAVYHNSFQRTGKGWRWTITERPPGNPPKLFARYDFTPASCRGLAFGF